MAEQYLYQTISGDLSIPPDGLPARTDYTLLETRGGLSLLLGVTFGLGIRGFWFGNAFSGCVPFLIGGTYLLSGTWKKRAAGPRAEE